MTTPTWLKPLILFSVIAPIAAFLWFQIYVHAPDQGQLGGPITGLTPNQLRKFYKAKETFKKEFSPEEGLGPIFNGKSCFECHGQPAQIGGEGRDVTSTGVIRIGKFFPNSKKAKEPLEKVITGLTREDVDLQFFEGGPALQRKSITSEFPNKYPIDSQIEIGIVPKDADFVSLRHSPPLFGFGLIEAIPDRSIIANVIKQTSEAPDLVGRVVTHLDPLTHQIRVGRFGWKNQNPNLMMFTTEAMSVEMGMTTFTQDSIKSPTGTSTIHGGIAKYLPKEPNDEGEITNALVYFQALLAPPKRGAITKEVKQGEQLFNQLQCAVCHIPEMSTSPVVYVVDPDSPAPQLRHMEIKALESQPVRAYSDFLLHDMGVKLADGLPQQGAKGGEWRTTPLWGLRNKRFLLHDGRTTDLAEAISLHGGQAEEVARRFDMLPEKDKQDLLAFLKTL